MSQRPRIYLDHAATTPILPAAKAAMMDAMDRWANPSSPHAEGRAARAALEDARARIKRALGWDGELIFTSGATEAIAIAMKGKGRYETISSAVEHDAVMRAAEGSARLRVGVGGRVATEYGSDLSAALDPREATEFFAIQAANNETGVLQPIDAINALRREDWVGRPTWLLCDCAQTAGKLPLPDADMIAIAAHKFGGPPGIGALLVKDLSLLMAGGGQERGYRGGTQNLPAIMGFASALELGSDWLARAAHLRHLLETRLATAGAEIVGRDAPRLPTIGAYRMPGMASEAQLIQFDLQGIAVSAGSACSSGSMKPSHVLAAMGWPEAQAREVIRVSFGPQTSEDEIDIFCSAWEKLAQRSHAA